MRVLAFDIETVPDLGGIDYRDYRYLRSRGKQDRSEEEFEQEFSFNPFTLFVVSVAGTYLSDTGIEESFVVYISDLSSEEREEEVFYDEGKSVKVRYVPVKADFVEGKLFELEERLLELFWNEVESCDRLVSFNGHSFDGYVLRTRSMIHGLSIPDGFLHNKNFHIDLMKFLSNWEWDKRYRLDFVCRKFGIRTPKDTLDGSKVAQTFHRGDYDAIALYNLKDTLALAQLFQKVKDYLLSEASEPQINFLADILSRLSGADRDKTREFVRDNFFSKQEATIFIDRLRKFEKFIKGHISGRRETSEELDDDIPF